ncbi:MAG: aldolase/citrate lyase family protein [Gammaproteobacteria bacterium]|nr:aldolase/citrate lyase family protein [Gammaproteobacteria bacterium]
MADRINGAVAKLAAGKPVFYVGGHAGADLTYDAGVAMADTWADYINVGFEHGPLDLPGLDQFMKGMASVRTPTPPVLVELPFEGRNAQFVEYNAWQVRQLLTTGVHGFLLCHAECPEAVEALVKSIRYTFRGGTRGTGGQGPASQIWGVSSAEYLEKADLWPINPVGELLLGLKIENRRALENAYETAKVRGVAFAEYGQGDMSMSYGFRGTPEDVQRPEIQATRRLVFDACNQAGICFLESCTEENLAEQLEAGVRIIPGTERLKKLGEQLM